MPRMGNPVGGEKYKSEAMKKRELEIHNEQKKFEKWLGMDEEEQKLFERTKQFVATTCPQLPENERIYVVAKIYDQMRFILKRVK